MSVHVPTPHIWSMAELRAQAAGTGEMIVEAHYSRLTGWTARTAPRRPALSRSYAVSNRDALTGRATRCTVSVADTGKGLRFEVDGDFASPDLALTLLDTCTHLRLLDGQSVAGTVAA